MLRSLVKNVAISAVAFSSISVIGLLLVPVLIRQYGIAGFGYISFVRLFLPTTALGIFDFGLGETTTQAVARARMDADWSRLGGILRLVVLLATVTGIVVGVALAGASPWLGEWLTITRQPDAFLHLIWATAALMPLLFMSLVFEGVIKGFERYVALRSLETFTSLLYAFLVLAIVRFSFDVTVVCYALLATQAFRAVVAAVLALKCLRCERIPLHQSKPEDFQYFKSLTFSMAANKVLGTSQTQLAPVLIGFFLGPAAVGTYDALSRLPRAAKAILGLLSSTILPLASKLESAADATGLRRLGHVGILLIGLLSMPPLVAAMVFSQPLLRLWIGSELSIFHIWQSSMFIVPALSVLLSFGGTALLVRPNVVKLMNRLTLLQIALQFALAWLAVSALQERAFILGQVVAVVVTFVPQLRLICGELGVHPRIYYQLARLVALLMVLALPVLWWVPSISNWIHLVGIMGIWTLVAWVASFFLVLPATYRNKITRILSCKIYSVEAPNE